MAKYLIEGASDGSLFAETVEAASQAEAEALAIERLCEAWREDPADVESLDDLGDVVHVTEYGPDDYARDEAPALVEALRGLVADATGAAVVARNECSARGDYAAPYVGRLTAAIEAARAILARIDGAAPTAGTDICPHCGRDYTGEPLQPDEPCADDCPQYWEGRGVPFPDGTPTGENGAATGGIEGHAFTVIWGNIGDDTGKRLDHVTVAEPTHEATG